MNATMSHDEFATVTAPDAVRIERLLPGPAERVWAYLTESDKRATWLGTGVMEPRVGSRFTLTWHNNQLTPNDDPPPPRWEKYGCEVGMAATITAWDPPRLLAFTWNEDEGSDSEVRMTLAPKGAQVLLTIDHVRLSSRGGMVGVSGGWHAHLEVLVARLRGVEPPGFWRTHGVVEAEYEARIPK